MTLRRTPVQTPVDDATFDRVPHYVRYSAITETTGLGRKRRRPAIIAHLPWSAAADYDLQERSYD